MDTPFQVVQDGEGQISLESHLHEKSPTCNQRINGKLLAQMKCQGCYTNDISSPACERCEACRAIEGYLGRRFGF